MASSGSGQTRRGLLSAARGESAVASPRADSGSATRAPDGLDSRARAISVLVLAVLGSLLLALHGHVLRWPFISDDYVFLSAHSG
jgi:hypothetical protein